MPINSEKTLEAYANLIVKVGLNLQQGQRLMIVAPIEAAPLARAVTKAAYQNSSPLVSTLFNDEIQQLFRFQFAPRDSFAEYPEWIADAMNGSAKHGDAQLFITAQDPDLLAGQDPELIALVQKTASEHLTPLRIEQMRNAVSWCVAGYPIPSWASKVFPDLPSAEAESRLGDAIVKTLRLEAPDPLAAWEQHVAGLRRRSDYLTQKHYQAGHLAGPGTDLTIGLTDAHLWLSGAERTLGGVEFVANLPTEEVFTLPHRGRAEGTVHSTKPLSYAGNLIKDFSVTFKDGHVVEIHAQQGEGVLRKLVETDEGAGRLGELALVPASSPIARMGILFYNTLFDENAASHVALGRGYPSSLQGSREMSREELLQAGTNDSLVHVDFMVGSPNVDVDGVTAGGSREPVMRKGEWAFEA